MPTWGQILNEVEEARPPAGSSESPADIVRRKYASELTAATGRTTIIYGSAWLHPTPAGPEILSVSIGDVNGFMEACAGEKHAGLDLLLHSPGGSPEGAESIMKYLRSQFDHIRAIVPVAAKSAATMMALSADEVVMGEHSQLGPIDPQITVQTPEGPRSASAQAIEEQFERGAKEIADDPSKLAAWMPILRGYGPGLLTTCAHAKALAEQIAAEALERYMLRGTSGAGDKAREIAHWFATPENFGSHARMVSAADASARGVEVTKLEDDDELQDAVLSVHHATMLTFDRTPCSKLIENDQGRGIIRITQQVAVGPPSAGSKEKAKRPRPKTKAASKGGRRRKK